MGSDRWCAQEFGSGRGRPTRYFVNSASSSSVSVSAAAPMFPAMWRALFGAWGRYQLLGLYEYPRGSDFPGRDIPGGGDLQCGDKDTRIRPVESCLMQPRTVACVVLIRHGCHHPGPACPSLRYFDGKATDLEPVRRGKRI